MAARLTEIVVDSHDPEGNEFCVLAERVDPD
jgi:hypothetical protein